MTLDAWVRAVNRLASALDAQAAATHPSAWREQLHVDIERYTTCCTQPTEEP